MSQPPGPGGGRPPRRKYKNSDESGDQLASVLKYLERTGYLPEVEHGTNQQIALFESESSDFSSFSPFDRSSFSSFSSISDISSISSSESYSESSSISDSEDGSMNAIIEVIMDDEQKQLKAVFDPNGKIGDIVLEIAQVIADSYGIPFDLHAVLYYLNQGDSSEDEDDWLMIWDETVNEEMENTQFITVATEFDKYHLEPRFTFVCSETTPDEEEAEYQEPQQEPSDILSGMDIFSNLFGGSK